MKAIAYCDGSGGSPKGSACAAIIVDPINAVVIAHRARPLPTGTSNRAEYEGLILALELAESLGVDDLHVLSDSQLIVNQVNEEWDVKEMSLLPFRERAWEAGASFSQLSLSWIRREHNQIADALCSQLIGNPFKKFSWDDPVYLPPSAT